ncbi:MAG: glycosyltransferase family 2 protein [bacterium]|nr:glycosyltransferase family 2 protein [bacterium]
MKKKIHSELVLKMQKEKVSLMITTYNWPEALELCLMSVLRQTLTPNEVIIADDGSTEDTRTLVETYIPRFKVPLIHVWQEDIGFRAAAIRNKAVAQSQFPYLIFIDGDMILHNDFIGDHIKFAEENCFLQGSRVLLRKDLSEQILHHKNIDFSVLTIGISNRKNMLKMEWLSKTLGIKNTHLTGIKSCNFSLFKKDFIKVNGFNEAFQGWGREDSELAVRLFNSRLYRKNIKFSAIQYHLYHSEHDRTNLSKNDYLLELAKQKKFTYCENGLDKYI